MVWNEIQREIDGWKRINNASLPEKKTRAEKELTRKMETNLICFDLTTKRTHDNLRLANSVAISMSHHDRT